jgi:curved DNA-binding protein CbpA
MNPYEELDVSRNATTEEIRQRYRILAQLHHPDKGGDEEIFKRIKLAYEILSDTIRRKEYDKTGKTHPDRDARNESLDIIGQLLFKIVPNFNPEIDNLIGMMTEDIFKTKEELNANITTCETYISKINKVIQRLNIKTDDENLILKFLEKQLDIRLQENLEFKRKIEICEIVLSILNDYEYGLASLMPPLDN